MGNNKGDEKFLGQACIVIGIIIFVLMLIMQDAEMYERVLVSMVGLLFLSCGIFVYKVGENTDKEWDELPNKTNVLAKKMGYTGYKATDTFDNRFSIDTNRWLLCYIDNQRGVHIFKPSSIIECTTEPETKMRNTAIRKGLMDGMFAGITGVGVIRDIDTLESVIIKDEIIYIILLHLNFLFYSKICF